MDELKKDIDIKKDDDEVEIDLVLLLSDLWKNVRKFWWLILIFIVAGAGGLYAFQALRYDPHVPEQRNLHCIYSGKFKRCLQFLL